MRFKLYKPLAIHEIGKRDNQEDSIYPLLGKASAEDRLFVVCDGMGGHEHGEVASQAFSLGLAKFFETNVSSSEVLDDETLKAAIEFAYKELDKKDDGAFKKMGTTLTLLYMHRGGVTCAHIGDSRIYHIRPGRGLLYVSRDHSLVFDLYQSGEISYDEMKTSPQKNIITRAIQPGEENRVRADIIHITDVQPDDYFYLCSDGMLEQMDNDEVASLFSSSASDEKKRQMLIAETIDNKDNHSAYIIHVETVTQEPGDSNLPNEEPTARCNALNIKPIIQKDEEPETNDVMVIRDENVKPSNPSKTPQVSTKKKSLLPYLFIACLLLVGGFVIYNFLSGDKKDENDKIEKLAEPSLKESPESERQQPIHRQPSTPPTATPPQPKPASPNAERPSATSENPNKAQGKPEQKAQSKDTLKHGQPTPQSAKDNKKNGTVEKMKGKDVFKNENGDKPQPQQPSEGEMI